MYHNNSLKKLRLKRWRGPGLPFGGHSAGIVNLQLKGFTNSWAIGGSRLTINRTAEMAQSLAAAREYVVQFCPFFIFLSSNCTYFE
jgi:hypothetical protein